jgi:hypothetical protein
VQGYLIGPGFMCTSPLNNIVQINKILMDYLLFFVRVDSSLVGHFGLNSRVMH